MIKVSIRYLNGITIRQRCKIWGKRFDGRHFGVPHQHWNYCYVALQSRGDLVSHIIILTKQPTPRGVVGHHQPLFAYDGDQSMASSDSLLNHASKVRTRADAGYIHKDAIRKPHIESIKDPSCIALCIVAPVANEDVLNYHENAPVGVKSETR